MLDDAFQAETDATLADIALRPLPPKDRRGSRIEALPDKPSTGPSVWQQAAEVLKSPFKGAGQAGLQTARVANTVAPISAGNPLAMTAAEQEELLQAGGLTRDSIDRGLRQGIDSLQPDPVTSTFASQFLQSAARVLTKAAAYGVVAGPAGAAVGTGVDEGVTGALEMQDRGVDATTAAKVGAIRGVTMGASIALPVVGQTALRTAGLVAAGGPAMFVAEQAATREVLNRANYGEVAKGYDPFDPMGLALSAFVPGVVGIAVHRGRARRAKGAAAQAQPVVADDVPPRAADVDPDLVDAALVAHRSESVRNAMLADVTNMKASESHYRAVDDAARALEEGAPVRIADAMVDPPMAARAMADLDARLAPLRAEIDTPATDLDITPPALLGDSVQPATAPVPPEVPSGMVETIAERVRETMGSVARPPQRSELQPAGTAPDRPMTPEVQRARELADRMPDMPVRMDDDGSAPMRASDLLEQTRQDAQRESVEVRKAFEAAVTCFLETGT